MIRFPMRTTRCCLLGLAFAAGDVAVAQSPQRELTVGLSNKEFQKEFDKRIKAKFAPISFSAHYDSRGTLQTAAVWEKRTAGRFSMKGGISQKETAKLVKKMAADGYRLELLTATAVGGEQYSSIWSLGPGQQLIVRYGYPAAELLKRHKEFTAKKYVIHSLTAFRDKGETYYTAAWERDDFAERAFYAGIPLGTLMKQTREKPKQGFRLRQVFAFNEGRRLSIACIWEKKSGPPQVVQPNLTEAALKKAEKKMADSGHVPAMITGISLAGRDRYLVVWEKPMKLSTK